MKIRILLPLLAVVLLTSSCSEYQKVLKSTDIGLKQQKAFEYYNAGQYAKAQPLLGDLLQYCRGTIQCEEVQFAFARTFFETGDYLLGAYHFKSYIETYPFGEKVEDAYYNYALSMYKNSPPYNQDQSTTQNAIDAFQIYLDRFPQSTRVEEINGKIDELRGRLERKAVENALLYYKIEDYKAAVTAIRDVLDQFPTTQYREELEFKLLRASYLLATQSVPSKQKERYQVALRYYNDFKEHFPNSQYMSQAEQMHRQAQNQVKD